MSWTAAPSSCSKMSKERGSEFLALSLTCPIENRDTGPAALEETGLQYLRARPQLDADGVAQDIRGPYRQFPIVPDVYRHRCNTGAHGPISIEHLEIR